MITDNALRHDVKCLKAFNNVSYKELSSQIGIKPKSLYAWLKEDFNLSAENKRKLELIIKSYKG